MELLLVVGILAILTSVSLAGLRIQKVNQSLLKDAQSIAGLLEKAKSYAANPRSEDYRPIYYLVRFDLTNPDGSNTTGNTEVTVQHSSRISLLVFEDENNDNGGDRSAVIETINLNNTRLLIADIQFGGWVSFNFDFLGGPMPTRKNIDSPNDSVDFYTCNPDAFSPGGFVSLGYKVGKPDQLLGRCYRDASGQLRGTPAINPEISIIPIFLSENAGSYTEETENDSLRILESTYISISDRGEKIQICRGSDTINETNCN